MVITNVKLYQFKVLDFKCIVSGKLARKTPLNSYFKS